MLIVRLMTFQGRLYDQKPTKQITYRILKLN